jgi:type I restriction enzyme R subunit
VIDFEGDNDLLAVQQFTVHGQKIRRPDIVLFVNGLPLVVIELKNPADPTPTIEGLQPDSDLQGRHPAAVLLQPAERHLGRHGRPIWLADADLGRHSRWRLLGGKKAAKGSSSWKC